MLDHQNLEGGDAAIHDSGKGWPGPPVNQSDRQMAQQVDDMCANAFLKNAGEFRPDAGKNRRGGKEAEDFCWSFRVHGRLFVRRSSASLQESRAVTKYDDRLAW